MKQKEIKIAAQIIKNILNLEELDLSKFSHKEIIPHLFKNGQFVPLLLNVSINGKNLFCTVISGKIVSDNNISFDAIGELNIYNALRSIAMPNKVMIRAVKCKHKDKLWEALLSKELKDGDLLVIVDSDCYKSYHRLIRHLNIQREIV